MSTLPTRADIDRMNRHIEQLVSEGFPFTEALQQASQEFLGGRRENGGEDIKLILLRAPDDESHQSPSFQQEIRDFDSALKANGVESSARWLTQDSVHAWCGYVGVITIPVVIIRAITPVIVAYMKRRTGRKVQIECDGLKLKVEEPTAEETDRLLKLVEQRQKELIEQRKNELIEPRQKTRLQKR